MSHAFTPTFWMKNKHLQTLYQTFFRKTTSPIFEIEEFILEDGDFTEVYWNKSKNAQDTTPIVILFHGLTGSYQSPYIEGMMKILVQEGYNTALMHFRGCSGKANKLARSYHSGETGDASYFINSLYLRYPNAKLYAIGFSLGGNMLLKLLGEVKQSTPLNAAISVSPPLELDTCANAIHKGFSRIYERRLVRELNATLIKKYSLMDMQNLIGYTTKEVKKFKTFWDFDGAYTAPVHGFDSAQEYYTKCSSRQFLKDIHIPTLIVHAMDDPFMDPSMFPDKSELSNSVELELNKNGGHVGFIEGSFFKPKYWLEERVVDFFNLKNK